MPHIRKPHKKSKNGCADCKKRRVKCDETRPSCVRCFKKGIPCNYMQLSTTKLSYPEYHLNNNLSNINSNQIESNNNKNKNTQSPPYKSLLQSKPVTNYEPHFQFNHHYKNDILVEYNNFQLPQQNRQNQIGSYNSISSILHLNKKQLIQNQGQNQPLNALNLTTLPPLQNNQKSILSSSPNSTRFSIPKNISVRNKSLSSMTSSNSTGTSPDDSITSLEDSSSKFYPQKFIPTHEDSLAVAQNIHERYSIVKCSQDYIVDSNNSHIDDSNKITNPSYCLPFTQEFNNTINKVKRVDLFSKVNIEKDVIQHSIRLPQHNTIIQNNNNNNNNNNKNFKLNNYCEPMFESKLINYSDILSLNMDNSMNSYGFMNEIFMKLNFYILNNFPFILSNSVIFQNLTLKCLQYYPLYDFLSHSINAIALLSLYHKNKINGEDNLLNYNSDVYLSMANYHISRSLKSLSVEVKMMETSRRAVCLQFSSILQTIYSVLSPNQKISSSSFLMSYKNSSYIYKKFISFLGNCKVFKDANNAMNLLDCNLNESSIYFPEYLYSLTEIDYSNNNPLNLNEKNSIILQINWLKRLFKLPNTEVNTEFVITIKRLFENVNDDFINLISIGEPRSLIVIGYSIMLLASKNNKLFKKSFFNNEINFIFERLDKLNDGENWKKWLNPVVEMINSN